MELIDVLCQERSTSGSMEVDPTLRTLRRRFCGFQRIAPAALVLSLVALAAVHHQITPLQRYGTPDLATSSMSAVRGKGGASSPADEVWDEDPAAPVPGGDAPQPEMSTQPIARSSVAICLVGGARAFELTGPSIKKYVLDVYDDADVFLHSPLDKDSHKFTTLRGAKNLAAARIFQPRFIPTSRAPGGLLTPSNSPNGIQGLLQYFSLVEGCVALIQEHAAEHNKSYDWVLRTRVDTFWNAPLPPLTSFSHQAYTVPYGSQFGGLNDRFGIGNWTSSKVALARLTLLPLLHANGHLHLNSESAFKLQLLLSQVPYQLRQLPFCVLSKRKYAWPPKHKGVPVASILSRGPLNGAKCRPCTPKVTGVEAVRTANRCGETWGRIGPVHDLQLCDATGDWESDWEHVYTRATGTDAATTTRQRLLLNGRSLGACVQELEAFKRDWASWDSPDSHQICALAFQS